MLNTNMALKSFFIVLLVIVLGGCNADVGIDKTLLSFFSVLLSLAKDPEGLVRVTVTLEDNKGNKRIRVIN